MLSTISPQGSQRKTYFAYYCDSAELHITQDTLQIIVRASKMDLQDQRPDKTQVAKAGGCPKPSGAISFDGCSPRISKTSTDRPAY